MLRIYWFLVLASLAAFAGCNKDDDDNPNDGSRFYISFKVNGQQYEYRSTPEHFNMEVFCMHNNPNASMTLYATSVIGKLNHAASMKDEMQLVVTMPSPLQTGITYTSGATTGAGQQQAEAFLLTWYNAQGDIFQCSFSHDVFGHESNGRFTIAEIVSDGLKGTFSGTFYNSDFTQSITVTEGRFYAWRIQ